MSTRTFQAPTMAEALSKVKQDLGRDAVIVHTRTVKVGGVMGVGGSTLVEIAAQLPEPAGPAPRAQARPQPRVSGTPRAPIADPSPLLSRAALVEDAFEPAVFPTLLPEAPAPSPEPVQAPPPEPPTPRPVTRPALSGSPGARRLSTPVSLKPADPETHEALQSELSSVKRMVAQLVRATRAGGNGAAAAVLSAGGLPDAVLDLYGNLLDAGVHAETADLIVGRVRDEAGHAGSLDPSRVRALAESTIADLFHADPPPTKDDARRVRAFVGPTGVGKTTTIAKLAASLKLRCGARVGLITADTYRIAAVEQLKTYATIIGLPIRVVLTPEEMRDAMRELSDCDAVLIDTAGRSQRDGERLDELRRMLAPARPDRTHLVLSAGAGEGVARRVIEGFAPLDPDALIFTKLDEADHAGHLLNLAVRASCPVSFVTFGQEVPDDLGPAEPAALARLVLDGPASMIGPA